MGHSTIIEINHDYYGEIFKSKSTKRLFLQQIQEQLASFKHNGKDMGGWKVILGCHRDDTGYDKFCRFVKSLNKGE